MEHLYRIDIEELANEIYCSVIEKISGHDIIYDKTEGTPLEDISQDSEDETEGRFLSYCINSRSVSTLSFGNILIHFFFVSI